MSLNSEIQPIIKVSGLTKKFKFGAGRPNSVKSLLVSLAQGKISFGGNSKDFTALNDISFEILPGEFVGIMGRNGAGKSTLLKIISGIYQPTTGSVAITGGIAPLIELGAGFNPELSGYENIFLNSAVLGFGRKATNTSLQAILDFAELGEHIYAPVRNYSSGMLVRLGFSIATHLEAPILLVDEILAVGDLGFQEKCIGKIRELHEKGRTIVLITHSPESVESHCSRCIVIDNHQKVYDGPAKEGVRVYSGLVR